MTSAALRMSTPPPKVGPCVDLGVRGQAVEVHRRQARVEDVAHGGVHLGAKRRAASEDGLQLLRTVRVIDDGYHVGVGEG